jgi:uncharacterized protein (DUF4415 family)
MRNDNTKMVRFSLPADGQLTDEQKARLEKLAAMPEEDIDLSDIPEITAKQWASGHPSHYRPVKTPVTIRLDADVVGWFKDKAGDAPYQTEINRVLRQHVARQLVQDRKKRA